MDVDIDYTDTLSIQRGLGTYINYCIACHSMKEVTLGSLKKVGLEEGLIKILSSPNHSNKSWVTSQYDQMVMCDTAQRSGSDAAIIRIHKKNKAIAVMDKEITISGDDNL